MLLEENPRGQAVHGVSLEYRDGGLQHNRAGIEVGRHQMDRGAVQALREAYDEWYRTGEIS